MAVTWLQNHSSDYRVDPGKIFVGGFSAGAYAALYAAYDHDPAIHRIAGVVSFSGGMLESDLNLINSGDPPAIFIHGSSDTIVPPGDSRQVYDRLKIQQVKTEYFTFPGGHGPFPGGHLHVRNFLLSLPPAPNPVQADFNLDGSVNLTDYNILVVGYGSQYNLSHYNQLITKYGR